MCHTLSRPDTVISLSPDSVISIQVLDWYNFCFFFLTPILQETEQLSHCTHVSYSVASRYGNLRKCRFSNVHTGVGLVQFLFLFLTPIPQETEQLSHCTHELVNVSKNIFCSFNHINSLQSFFMINGSSCVWLC